MKKAKTIIAVILVVLVAIVILQNMESVDTEILWKTIPMPRAVLLIITFLIGFVMGMIASDRLRRRKKS